MTRRKNCNATDAMGKYFNSQQTFKAWGSSSSIQIDVLFELRNPMLWWQIVDFPRLSSSGTDSLLSFDVVKIKIRARDSLGKVGSLRCRNA